MPKKQNLIGQRFTRLLVLEEGIPKYTPSGQKQITWVCKCDCGNVVTVRARALKVKDNKSCGCLNKENAKIKATNMYKFRSNIKSIQKGSHEWKEYAVWRSMCDRCNNPNTKTWDYYGGKGIKVCKRWLESFDNFFYDIGPIPKGLEIDRYPDMDGNYKPSNVRLATRSQNVKNRDYDKIMAKRIRNSKGQFK